MAHAFTVINKKRKMIHIFQQLAATCDPPKFFGIPTWYKYLEKEVDTVTGKCEVNITLMTGGGQGEFRGSDILLIGLGVIDILIHIAALVAVAFVFYGGIRYITSQGSPDGTKAAQNTILNALIGLAISVVAAAVVAFLGRAIK